MIGGKTMEAYRKFIQEIADQNHRDRMEEILSWTHSQFPSLKPEFKWNQPMFSDHETYIIGFSVSKQHIAISPEQAGIEHFAEALEEAGYDYSKMIFRIKWNQPVDYKLLEKIIQYNIIDKAECKTFWR